MDKTLGELKTFSASKPAFLRAAPLNKSKSDSKSDGKWRLAWAIISSGDACRVRSQIWPPGPAHHAMGIRFNSAKAGSMSRRFSNKSTTSEGASSRGVTFRSSDTAAASPAASPVA
jgi:hypothetical protein